MIIYIDDNMAPILAQGFNILQQHEGLKHGLKEKIEVRSLKKEFGEGVDDEVWIPKVGTKACVITQDYNIQRIRHQRELCIQYGLGMFYFRPPSKKGFTYWEMLKMLVKHWPEIIKVVSKKKRPFSYKVTSASSRLEELKD